MKLFSYVSVGHKNAAHFELGFHANIHKIFNHIESGEIFIYVLDFHVAVTFICSEF